MIGIKSFFLGKTKYIITGHLHETKKSTILFTRLVGEKHKLLANQFYTMAFNLISNFHSSYFDSRNYFSEVLGDPLE